MSYKGKAKLLLISQTFFFPFLLEMCIRNDLSGTRFSVGATFPVIFVLWVMRKLFY